MNRSRKRRIFNWAGAGIVVLWLVMLGLLTKKVVHKGAAGSRPEEPTFNSVVEPRRDWMEIYLQDRKVGYAVIEVSPIDEKFLLREETFLSLDLMGQASTVRTVTRSVVDGNFQLESFRFRMSSGVVSFELTGTVAEDSLIVAAGRHGEQRTERIPLSEPPMVPASMGYYFKGRELEVGRSFTLPFFDPSTMSLQRLALRVTGRETVSIRQGRYRAYRLEARMWGRTLIFWLDDSGTILKERGFLGFTLVKSSAAKAPFDIAGSGDRDLYELASIPVEGRISHAERVARLRVAMEGLEQTGLDPAVLNANRQQFRDGIMTITRERLPAHTPYTLPFGDGDQEMSRFLHSSLHVQSDNEAIREQARDVVGAVRDPVTAAERLMVWVYRRLEKRPVISVPSAVEVLETGTGDCNEHSVLLTALLRAAGIPARTCVGLVFHRGQFFYHAWNECYLGTWVSLDATLNQMPADATHIKLVQGGLDRQLELMRVMGRLRMEIVDYAYD